MRKILYTALGAVFFSAAVTSVHRTVLISWADGPSQQSSSAEEIGPGAGPFSPSDSGSTSPVSRREIGPGVGEETAGGTTLLPVVLVPNNFLNNPIADPVVKVTDKYTHEQMEADIFALKERYGEKLSVNIIGQSLDNRAIYEVVVGNPDAPNHILFQGAIHGREYMTPLLMMSQLELALANYDTGHYDHMALSDMFGQAALHFVPMINPDGVSVSQFGLSAIRSDSLRQEITASYNRDVEAGKTDFSLEQYLPYWKSNARGVDLNYNFPAWWDLIQNSSTAGSYAGYKGTAPLSEPESQALSSLSGQRTWAATVSYHSMGNIIYWDTDGNQASESSFALAQAVSQATGYRLDPGKGKGGFKDFLQTNGQAIPSVTVEVGSLACPMPVSEFESVWNQNKSVWAKVMNHVLKR